MQLKRKIHVKWQLLLTNITYRATLKHKFENKILKVAVKIV